MKRRGLTIAAIVVAVGAALAAFWMLRRPDPATDTDAAPNETDAAIVAKKLSARAGLSEAPCSARGRVLRADDGTPVADAVVVLQRANPYGRETLDAIVQRTDDSGEWVKQDLEPGLYMLSASGPNLEPLAQTRVRLSAGKSHNDLDLRLKSGTPTLAGTVTDRQGQPIAGVRVDIVPSTDAATASPRVFATLTDAQGRYSLSLLPGAHTLTLVHADHVTQTTPVVIGQSLRTRDYQLVPGSTIAGRVVSRDSGEPVPHAEVRLQPPAGTFGGQLLTRTRADAEGRFTLRGVATGTAQVEAFARGFGTTQATNVPLGVGDRVEDVEILVDVGRTVSGFIVWDDAETEGVPDMVVNLTSLTQFGLAWLSEPTGPDGYFEVLGVAPGTYMMVAMGEAAVITVGATIEIDDQDKTDTLLRVTRGIMVRGRVDPPGPALIHAAVRAKDLNSGNPLKVMQYTRAVNSTFRRARAQEDGTFEFGPMAPGPYILSATTPDGRYAETRLEVEDEDLAKIDLSLLDGVGVRGRVVDIENRGLAGLSVSFHRVDGEKRIDLSSYLGAVSTVAVTDAEGRFELSGLSPGVYSYSVRNDRLCRIPFGTPEDPDVPFRPRRLDVQAPVTDLTIALRSSRALQGRVLDPEGKPIAGAWISAWPDMPAKAINHLVDAGPEAGLADLDKVQRLDNEDGGPGMRRVLRAFADNAVLSDAEGRFVIPDLRYAKYTVSAEAARGEWRVEVEGVDPGESIDLELQELAAIHGSIEGGLPPEGTYAVHVTGPDVQHLSRRRDDPTFDVARLRPGRYTVRVEADGGIHVAELELKPGQTAQLAAPLHAWGSVKGTIVDAVTGKPIGPMTHRIAADPDASIGEMVRQGQDAISAVSGAAPRTVDDNGVFELGRLPPGRTLIVFLTTPALQEQAELLVELGPGEHKDVGEIRGINLAFVDKTKQGRLGLGTDVRRPDKGLGRLVIDRLYTGEPGASAGLKLGDRIVSVDDLQADEIGPVVLKQLLRQKFVEVGQTRRLVVNRDGERIEVEVRAVRPPDD